MTASPLLNSSAVSRRSGEEAGEILGAYIATNPAMALNHTAEAAPTQAPKGTGGAVDPTR
jgi:hypothetical protein